MTVANVTLLAVVLLTSRIAQIYTMSILSEQLTPWKPLQQAAQSHMHMQQGGCA